MAMLRQCLAEVRRLRPGWEAADERHLETGTALSDAFERHDAAPIVLREVLEWPDEAYDPAGVRKELK